MEKPNQRFLPIDGFRLSPPKDNAHVGADEKTRLRVQHYRSSGVVVKCNIANWTPEANAKFAEMYCNGVEGKDEGEDPAWMKRRGRIERERSSRRANDELAKMQKMMKQMQADYERLHKAEKKLREREAEEEKKRVAEAEKKAKAEALKAELLLLEQQEEEDGYNSSDFPDSDYEGQVWNPYEHNGVQYHRDDDLLYTKEGEYYGTIDKDGNVDLRPRLWSSSSDDFSDEDDEDQESNPEELWSPLTEPIAKETKSLGETKTHEPVAAQPDSKRCKSYTKEEDRKIEDYMTNPENLGRKKAPLYRELQKILPGRKFENIGTRWERYVRPEMFKRQRDEVEAENADLKSQLETLKSNLLNIAQSIKI